MTVQFKIVNKVLFHSTNGRSWMENMGEYAKEYSAWLASLSEQELNDSCPL